MLSRREKLLIALLPPLAIIGVQMFVFAPATEARAHSAEAKLLAHGASEVAARAAVDKSNRIDALRREAAALEKLVNDAEKRGPAFLNRWTRPERRAQVVSDLAQLLASNGIRLRASSSAPASAAPDVPALRELVKSMRELGGAEPETWRFDLSCDFSSLLTVLGALSQSEAFVLPLSIRAVPSERDGRLDVVLWTWI